MKAQSTSSGKGKGGTKAGGNARRAVRGITRELKMNKAKSAGALRGNAGRKPKSTYQKKTGKP